MDNWLPIIGYILILLSLFQLIKLQRQTRIINSMTLKVLLKICEKENIDIDIQKIQSEVTDNL